MTSTEPRDFWAVELHGGEYDLSGWQDALKMGFDPYVIDHPKSAYPLLRSSEFDNLQSAGEVRDRARILIGALNGALRATKGCGPVSMANVIDARIDGAFHRIMHCEMGAYEIKFGRVDLIYSGAPAGPPKPSPAQRWIKLAAKDGVASELLMHFGRDAPNWFDLYKAYECLRTYTKTERSLEILFGIRKDKQLDRFMHTANYHRHGSDHHSRKNPPSDPMTLQEAEEYIRERIENSLNVLAP